MLHALVATLLLAAPPDSSRLVIAGPDEPGTRLVVSGRVLQRDGRTPAAHARVGVYHTDASGEYGEHPTRRSYGFARDARLSGWLVTDARGRFEVHTIRPGHYPGGRTPQHVHFIVGGVNQELCFADDRLLRGEAGRRQEGASRHVRPVTRGADGVEHVSVELRLR
jgi:protocatechuate 3,4-dioxygenase beta subunit